MVRLVLYNEIRLFFQHFHLFLCSKHIPLQVSLFFYFLFIVTFCEHQNGLQLPAGECALYTIHAVSCLPLCDVVSTEVIIAKNSEWSNSQ